MNINPYACCNQNINTTRIVFIMSQYVPFIFGLHQLAQNSFQTKIHYIQTWNPFKLISSAGYTKTEYFFENHMVPLH